ncbi:eCIS core domain-containing protein [Deinococcus sp. UYEF24]
MTEHLNSAGNLEGALQRKVARDAPVAPLTQAPSQPGDWIQAARLEVQRVTEPGAPEQTRWLSGAERDRHLGALRSVGQGLAQAFRADRGPAVQRYAAYGEGLATLQRQALTGAIPRMVLAQVSPAERPHLQRAVDAALQRQQEEEAKDASALYLHSLQRQLAALDLQAELPILERIQARKGGGVPLPASVQRQLEAGLNHDLSGVRIHTDGEADLLSKKVNAVAFTTGQDIYFQSGRFDPNSRTGIELLAHEATHAVQQSRGQVGKGIDPDAGLESEARQFGSRFSSVVNQADLHRPVSTARTPGSVSRRPITSQLISGQLSASPIQRLSAPVLQRPGETPSPARVNSAEAGERGYVTAEQGVRLFASPHQVGGPAHSALPTIAHGTILRLLEHQDGWYKVSTASGVG